MCRIGLATHGPRALGHSKLDFLLRTVEEGCREKRLELVGLFHEVNRERLALPVVWLRELFSNSIGFFPWREWLEPGVVLLVYFVED